MGNARARRPSNSTASAAPAAEQATERGPASSGGFQAGLEANAPSASTSAEGQRLRHELSRLAQRNAWSGVERAYQQLVTLGEADGDAHILGAQAAQNTGNMRESQMRYRKARAAGADVDAQLSSIEDNFNAAYLQTQTRRPKSDKKAEGIGAPELHIAAMPFAPDHRKAIEHAQRELQSSWSFNGLLPFGQYTLTHEGRTETFENASFSNRVQLTV